MLFACVACTVEKPVEQKKPAPIAIVKPKLQRLTPEQRAELKFPPDLIEKLEAAAGAKAEPFFTTVVLQSENLKGEEKFESKKLAGFSVRTTKADELIAAFRQKGYQIFKSHKGYGTLPDLVTVVKGNNSYDVLRIQGTEAASYHHDTKTIIAWLKARQREGSFVITGAGPDWVEARFIKPPQDMIAFAQNMSVFAPDVLVRDTRTVEKLAEQIEKTNTFYLTWD
jgi:hypothetical protein